MRGMSMYQPILQAKATTGIGQVLDVSDFDILIVQIATSGNANCTVKACGSIQDEEPIFTSTSTPANQWDTLQMKKSKDNTSIDGDTGYVLTGTDGYVMAEINVNGIKWFTFNITAISAGAVTAGMKTFSHGGAE